jgi:hypothetical protein
MPGEEVSTKKSGARQKEKERRPKTEAGRAADSGRWNSDRVFHRNIYFHERSCRFDSVYAVFSPVRT